VSGCCQIHILPCEWGREIESRGHMEEFQDGLERDTVFLSKISQVVRHGFMGITQEPSNSHLSLTAHQPYTQNSKTSSLKLGEHPLCFLCHSQSCALWICSTRTDCKPTLLTRHLTVSGRKHVVKTTWKMEFRPMGFSIMNMHLFILLCMSKTF